MKERIEKHWKPIELRRKSEWRVVVGGREFDVVQAAELEERELFYEFDDLVAEDGRAEEIHAYLVARRLDWPPPMIDTASGRRIFGHTLVVRAEKVE